jgi:uncharacterized protein involved in cysteine biosynthesis
MLTPLMLAIRQLSDPRLLGVLAKSLALTLVLFAAIGAALWWLIMGRDPCALVAGYSCPIGSGSGAIVATLLTLAGLWLLFPAIATGVMGLFSDEVVAAVEERHYPRRAVAARKIGRDVSLRMALGSAGRLIGYNLIALPFYLLLLLTAIGPVFLFLAVNGAALVLVGRAEKGGERSRIPADHALQTGRRNRAHRNRGGWGRRGGRAGRERQAGEQDGGGTNGHRFLR